MGCVFSGTGCLAKPVKNNMADNTTKTAVVARDANGNPPLYTCEICGQEGLTEVDMRSHILIEHVEGSVSCPFCDLEGTSVEEMNLHVNSQHLDFFTPTKDPKNNGNKEIVLEPVENLSPLSPGTNPQLNSEGNSSQASSSQSDSTQEECKTSPTASVASSSGNNSTLPTSPMEITITEVLDSPERQLPLSLEKQGNVFRDDEQSRKRAKLYLNVPQASPNRSKIPSPSASICDNSNSDRICENKENMYTCPMCSWSTASAGEITKHVNIAHLDALTPSKSVEKINSDLVAFECPLCNTQLDSGSTLELHVNSIHSDILSPAVTPQGVGSRTPASVDGLSVGSGAQPMCPVCGMEFDEPADLAFHVDGHFSADHTPVSETGDNLLAQEIERKEREAAKHQEQKELERLQDIYGMSSKSSYKKQAEKNMEKALYNGQLTISDYYVRKTEVLTANTTGVDDGHSCTQGIINRLKQHYKAPTTYGVSRVWLCSSMDHYAASYGDKGWGCGYRNLQMLLSCLSSDKTYEQVLFNGRPLIPSIPKIQRLIEAAWQKGFDVQGCEQLGGQLINTTKWIGATEIVATLSSLNIKCSLSDFHAPTGKDGTHPRLFEWVRDYFKDDGEFKPPLYLQHQGHSRTIIGIEELKDGALRLLIFDPSCSRRQMQQFLGDLNSNLMRCIRRSAHAMKAKQYQIVSVHGILAEQEYDESKVMKSDRIP